jgi:hypothetical protein
VGWDKRDIPSHALWCPSQEDRSGHFIFLVTLINLQDPHSDPSHSLNVEDQFDRLSDEYVYFLDTLSFISNDTFLPTILELSLQDLFEGKRLIIQQPNKLILRRHQSFP